MQSQNNLSQGTSAGPSSGQSPVNLTPDCRSNTPPDASHRKLVLSDDWRIFIAFPCFILGYLGATGNLWTGPRLEDDNQILRLQIELEEGGFFAVLVDELESRWGMQRLLPTYCVQKVVLAHIFGANFTAWTIWNGLVGAATGCLLYLFMRTWHYSYFESIVFALLTILGEQSILWWRTLHGEGIGMLLLAASLVVIARRVNIGKLRFELIFCILLTLAVLCKESFVLLIPALLFLKLWKTYQLPQTRFVGALRANLLSIAWLIGVTATVGTVVLFVFRTTGFSYAGWEGFDGERFFVTWSQYAWVMNSWLIVPLLAAFAMTIFLPPGDAKSSLTTPRFNRTFYSFLCAWIFCVLVVLPQLLLYMKTGISNDVTSEADFSRYIVPGILGYAFAVAHTLCLVRQQPSRWIWPGRLATAAVVLALLVNSVVAYREGRVYADYSHTNDRWFETIETNTDPNDPIVLVYLNSADGEYPTQVALRVYYILSQRHGRSNFYCCPIPPEPSVSAGAANAKRDDTRYHGMKLHAINDLSVSVPINTILILNWGKIVNVPGPVGPTLDKLLPQFQPTWFQRSEFRREQHPHHHVSYFRTEPPSRPQPD